MKKHLRILAVLFVVVAMTFSMSFCYAANKNEAKVESNTTAENKAAENTTDGADAATGDAAEENVHTGDLYIFDTNVTMDKLVDGNVYIFGNDVTVTGRVNGNLFVCATKVKFDNCYVRYSIYACATEVEYNGACNDLYVATEKLNMTYDSYVIRDVKALSNSAIFKAAVGRDADLKTNTVDFGDLDAAHSDEKTSENSESKPQVPLIYGDIRYSANEEKNLTNTEVQGNITYTPLNITSGNKSVAETVKDIVVTFLVIVVAVLVIYALLAKYKPDYVAKLADNHSVGFIVKRVLWGFVAFVAAIVLAIILAMTEIGIHLSFIVLASLLLLGLLATPIAIIYITKLLKPVLKIEKTYLFYVVLALVAIILRGLKFIPWGVGGWIGFLVFLFGFGLLVHTIVPHKENVKE